MVAVGWTILNRSQSQPFPATPCGVVYQGGEDVLEPLESAIIFSTDSDAQPDFWFLKPYLGQFGQLR